VAYSTQMAAALSGATPGQIRSWRQDRGAGPFLRPELGIRPRALYSFRDILALRAFARLREDFSLQALRRAVGNLRDLGEIDPLSAYSLVADGRSIALYEDDEHATDLLNKPGQRVFAVSELISLFDGQIGELVHDHHFARHVDHVAGEDPAPGAPGEPDTTLIRVGVHRVVPVAVPTDDRPARDADSPIPLRAGLEPRDLPPSRPVPASSSRHAGFVCEVRQRLSMNSDSTLGFGASVLMSFDSGRPLAVGASTGSASWRHRWRRTPRPGLLAPCSMGALETAARTAEIVGKDLAAGPLRNIVDLLS
jgi:DNA-binding transcriptional MerR regulator